MTPIFAFPTCPVNEVSEQMDPLFLSPLVSSAVSLQGWNRKVGIYTVLGFDGKASLRSSYYSSGRLSLP